ncbi:AAA family ATPase [Campylobacter coli]|uniref:AAA family ATPase n=1 Tax=Campylobacter coli TaxID=195 RepID=UPI00070778F5|nr:AAA family ATPase [Campylobacter coli]EAK0212344.1 hypothetical protein [Campylobacter jejuni]EAJ4519103.1 hypothetical protein [Campylobacter coli]EAK2897006.1 hypothetical protein [Campylobacter coli]EAL4587044.1 hypothetical protein [Campylobacter coli]ECR5293044.1 AAA family ATPase [Campylobacter coli]
MAIKILISGFENTGKSTLVSKLEDSLIINCDKKDFAFQTLHTNKQDYKGLDDFKKFCNEKILAYKNKYNKLPKYVVIDTITQLYGSMTNYNSSVYKGFNIHSQNESDTLGINEYLEQLVSKGINIVISAHTKYNSDTGRYEIPSQGKFRDSGSWLSIVNEAIHISRDEENHLVHLKSKSLPVRSLIDWDKDSVNFNDFDINEYCSKIISVQAENEKFLI